jgi:ribonuclease BN (tRNA processing enzyme)
MLTILGSGGWFPAHGRQTGSALLRVEDRAIMIDAGTGVATLVERPELLDGLDGLDILLTHFHLDHVVGLAALPAVGLCPRTTVWGPGKLLYGSPTGQVLDRLTHEPVHPVPFEHQDIQVRDLPAEEVELAGMRVAIRRQDRHSAPTLAFRFDDQLAWITDTAYDPASGSFAQGCELLAHEAWFTTADPRNVDIHSSAAQAARVAIDADAERLLLIHLPPFHRSIEPLALEARAVYPNAGPAIDGMDVPAFVGCGDLG